LSVRRYASYNFIGAVLPLGLSLITVPLYLERIGPDRYGVLAIAWLLLGYFGLFDLGLGRATSFRIAALRESSRDERATTFWSALAVNVAMGLVGAVVLWLAASFFFGRVMKVPEALRPEVLAAIPMLALAVPIATMTGVLTGAMQGREKFLETNIISTISTALFQLLPLSVAYIHGPDLPVLLAAAVGARSVAILVLGYRCYVELLRAARARFDRSEIPQLLKYGGWVNLTSIIGPVLMIVDRFAIGAQLGAAQLAVYTVPFQLAQRIVILPSSLTNALFPRMSASDEETREKLAQKAVLTLACVVSPVVLGGVLVLEPFLHVWVGSDIARDAGPVGRTLMLGFWANAFALVPFTRLQASGRPDLIPKVHMVEIPFYLVTLFVGMKFFGLFGAAAAYALRCIADYALLSWVAARRLHYAPLLLANFIILLAASVASQVWTLRDPVWWAASAILVTLMLAISWRYLPSDLKQRLPPPMRR
jgi:O-antigen/teichoic acid export membrane protein